MSNYDTSKKGRDHVKKSLEKEGWKVKIIGTKDEYFEIEKNSKSRLIKVKTLTNKTHIAFGSTSDEWKKADFMIICRFLENKKPELFISNIEQIVLGINSRPDYSEWLSSKIYEKFETSLSVLNGESLFQKILRLSKKLRIKF